MCYSIKNKEHGFTLIELLIAMTIGLIILAALSSTFLIQRKTYVVQEQIVEMVQNARAAMDIMTREIRMGGYNPASASFNGITYSTSQLQIKADLDGDGNTTGSYEDITYSYDATNSQIDRNTGGGNQPFAENIQAFTFSYLDGSGVTTTTTSDIRQIEITITAKTAEPGHTDYTLISLITPRNLAF